MYMFVYIHIYIYSYTFKCLYEKQYILRDIFEIPTLHPTSKNLMQGKSAGTHICIYIYIFGGKETMRFSLRNQSNDHFSH